VKCEIDMTGDNWNQLVSEDVKGRLDPELSQFIRSEECLVERLSALAHLEERTKMHLQRRQREIAAAEAIDDVEAANAAREAMIGTLAFRSNLVPELERARAAQKTGEAARLRALTTLLAREFEPEDWEEILTELPSEITGDARAARARLAETA